MHIGYWMSNNLYNSLCSNILYRSFMQLCRSLIVISAGNIPSVAVLLAALRCWARDCASRVNTSKLQLIINCLNKLLCLNKSKLIRARQARLQFAATATLTILDQIQDLMWCAVYDALISNSKCVPRPNVSSGIVLPDSFENHDNNVNQVVLNSSTVNDSETDAESDFSLVRLSSSSDFHCSVDLPFHDNCECQFEHNCHP